MNKVAKYIIIVMAVCAVAGVIREAVEYFLPNVIEGVSVKEIKAYLEKMLFGPNGIEYTSAQYIWGHNSIDNALNYILVSMFVGVYVPFMAVAFVAAITSPMGVFLLIPYAVVLLISMLLWPLACLGIICVIPAMYVWEINPEDY